MITGAAKTTGSRALLLPQFGLGFWWVFLLWHFFPQPSSMAHHVAHPTSIMRLMLMIGLTLSTLSFALFNRRLRSLYGRNAIVAGLLTLGSAGVILTRLADSGVVAGGWLFFGLTAAGAALGVPLLQWMETFAQTGSKSASISASGSMVLGSVLYLLLVALSGVSTLIVTIAIALMPWLATVCLTVSRRHQAPSEDRAVPGRKGSSVPPLILGGGFVYSVAYAFMLSFLVHGSTVPATLAATHTAAVLGWSIAGVLLLIGAVRSKGEPDLGVAIRPALPLVAIGVLLLPVVGTGRSYIVAAAVAAGYGFFWILSTIIAVTLARRLSVSSLLVGGLVCAVSATGNAVGVAAEILVLRGEAGTQGLPAVVSLVIVFALLLASTFAVSDRSVSTLWGLAGAGSPRHQGISLEQRCAAMAAAFGLTPREREVLVMLAKGRNTEYIQRTLVVSSNTVRTHIRRIYEKLDVHSHQELIDMAESFKPAEDDVVE
ncbi:MAG: response regulator transcription factor [Coriobacteriia bacterium]